MRTLSIGATIGILVVALSACGGAGSNSASEAQQRDADMYAVSQIERRFHEAISKKDIDEMVGLFSEHATGTFRPGQTVSGRKQIADAWESSIGWKPQTHWLSDHPAYKLKITIDGDRGTLQFECHFVDLDTEKIAAVTAANVDVAKIDGSWLITNFVGSTAELKI